MWILLTDKHQLTQDCNLSTELTCSPFSLHCTLYYWHLLTQQTLGYLLTLSHPEKVASFIQFWHFSFSHSGVFCIDVLFDLATALRCSPWSSSQALTGACFSEITQHSPAVQAHSLPQVCAFMCNRKCVCYLIIRAHISYVSIAACSSSSHRDC